MRMTKPTVHRPERWHRCPQFVLGVNAPSSARRPRRRTTPARTETHTGSGRSSYQTTRQAALRRPISTPASPQPEPGLCLRRLRWRCRRLVCLEGRCGESVAKQWGTQHRALDRCPVRLPPPVEQIAGSDDRYGERVDEFGTVVDAR
jgi:hypothetical protein